MFPLAHSNYRDISLIFKSAVSTIPPFRHIFKERLHLYYTKKSIYYPNKFGTFSLSGEQWNRTICHKARSTLAGCPYRHQGLLSIIV